MNDQQLLDEVSTLVTKMQTRILARFDELKSQTEAREKNTGQVAEFMRRLDAKLDDDKERQERQETAVNALREDFQTVAEIVSSNVADINDLKQTVAEHEREIASFRQSRDASIAERRQLGIDLAASKEDRAKIHEELRTAAEERRAITEALARIEARLPAGDD
jgi:DNA repair exonuclease SbcCD ATPase subunit